MESHHRNGWYVGEGTRTSWFWAGLNSQGLVKSMYYRLQYSETSSRQVFYIQVKPRSVVLHSCIVVGCERGGTYMTPV